MHMCILEKAQEHINKIVSWQLPLKYFLVIHVAGRPPIAINRLNEAFILPPIYHDFDFTLFQKYPKGDTI